MAIGSSTGGNLRKGIFNLVFSLSHLILTFFGLGYQNQGHGDIIIAYKKDFLKHTEALSGLGKVRQVFKIADIIF